MGVGIVTIYSGCRCKDRFTVEVEYNEAIDKKGIL